MCDFLRGGSETDRVQTERHKLSREKLCRWSETGVVFARGQVLLVLQPYHSGSGLDRKRVFFAF